jgi:AcrR family transcriptional regulator
VSRYRAGIETQRRILEATGMLLAEVGLEGTTLKAICERAGVRAGSFYNLFDTKEEAVLTVVREAIEAVDPDPDHIGRDSVADLVGAFIAFVESRPYLARVYVQIAVGGANTTEHLSGRVLRHQRRRAERFTAAMRRDHPDLSEAEARRRALLLLATLNGLTLSSIVDPSVDFAALAGALIAGDGDATAAQTGPQARRISRS